MFMANLIRAVLYLAILASIIQISTCFTVPMRLLVLSPTDDAANLGVVQRALAARGIPYETILLPYGKFIYFSLSSLLPIINV